MGPFRRRSRGNSLSTVPPSIDTADYSTKNAELAAAILYRSPLPSSNDLPVYILNSAAFPDSNEVLYDALLPYVLARLPSDEQLIGGKGYEVVFFAGGEEQPSGSPKKARPSWGWFVQAYHVLSRAMRKRLQKLYLVHERRWVRVMSEMFSTIVSPKFRRKVVHVSSLSSLALHIPIEDLLIPPSAYERDRRLVSEIYVPYASGRRAFGSSHPLPTSKDGDLRLPRVLRETSKFVLMEPNIKTEGIFRVNSRAITTEVLKEAYDRGQKFILWKDYPAVLAPTHFKEGHGDVSINEIDAVDGYSVPTAAGLIKTWYSSLRDPLFPPSCYPFLTRVYGGTSPISVSTFLDLISQSAEWSPLSRNAKHILTMHLFPLLSRVAAYSSENKMSARNLATCFAPSTICGPDPIEDVKMSAVVTRILEFGISHWAEDLAPKCSMDGETFENMLETPKDPEDREDPLDSSISRTRSQAHRRTESGEQMQGIAMLDNESSSDAEEEANTATTPASATRPMARMGRIATGTDPHILSNTVLHADPLSDSDDEPPPPLPPRSAISSEPPSPNPSSSNNATSQFKRKPAPPVQNPPRYSTLMGPAPHGSEFNSSNQFEGYGVGSLPGFDETAQEDDTFWGSGDGGRPQAEGPNAGSEQMEGQLIDISEDGALPSYGDHEYHGNDHSPMGTGGSDASSAYHSATSGTVGVLPEKSSAPKPMLPPEKESASEARVEPETSTESERRDLGSRVGSGLSILRKPVGGSAAESTESSPVVGRGEGNPDGEKKKPI